MKPIQLYFIRHGQSEGNLNTQVYYDKHDCDIELTDLGHNQSLEAGHELVNIIDDVHPRIIYSPYRRAVQTAADIHSVLVGKDIYPSSEENVLLREREWGNLRTIVDNRHLKREEHFNFYHRADHGESYADAYQRVVAFFQEIRIKRLMDPSEDRPIIIVSHGEWIRLALMYLDRRSVEYFAINRKNPKNCEIQGRRFT